MLFSLFYFLFLSSQQNCISLNRMVLFSRLNNNLWLDLHTYICTWSYINIHIHMYTNTCDKETKQATYAVFPFSFPTWYIYIYIFNTQLPSLFISSLSLFYHPNRVTQSSKANIFFNGSREQYVRMEVVSTHLVLCTARTKQSITIFRIWQVLRITLR